MAQTLTEAVRLGDHAAAGVAAMVVGTVANIAGRYRDATRWLSEAELQYEQQDTFGVLVIARQALVGVARQTGNADRTIETARRCLERLKGGTRCRRRFRMWRAHVPGRLKREEISSPLSGFCSTPPTNSRMIRCIAR